ncbi:subunit of the ESCRT-I complex [Monoraphidium neglectum]|uniref:Subunit of the ESCRT-I complex n=1 Tax=Monoraphidium neglectum TaxID=145388 RepID=A0A0D2MZA0_9CHLO|nr:subunit of the ESCRT-I complex [Monoraphidium neglectum]KIZ07730.1 subunit of the ESCRT-I complex [Monoraphidium neglectum]|eukprot:XP_013906749.1 subunit of the ESCRT-I complex [Monoraphidium neglectum]
MAYGGYPGYGALELERVQHVDSLLRRYPAKPINPDRSVFDLPLELRDGKATALRISLPPHFPQERPSLSMLLPVVHPAVDSTGRLHTPGLANWVYGQSSLADAVAEAVATLTSAVVDARQPGAQATGGGRIGPIPYPPGYPSPPSGLLAGAAGAGPGSPQARVSSSSAASAAAAAGGQLPDLSRLAPAQLASLLSDDSEFKALLRGVVANSQMAATLEDIRVKNRQLAAANLSQQGAMAEARNQLAIVRSSEYQVIRARFDELLARQSSVSKVLGGPLFRERLEDAVSEADAASSAVSTAFLLGQVPLDQFVEQYVELRARHHALDLKRQAAEQVLRSQ